LLSGLQQDIARLLAGLPEAEGFALAGGGALIALGIVDRHTGGLDFFGRESVAVDRLGPAFEAAAAAAGLSVTRLRDAPGFVRLEVARGDERSEVDLGYDARLWPVRQTPLGPAIADSELAADKTLALFGRAAARDYLDVHALTRRYPEDQLIGFAALKDRASRQPIWVMRSRPSIGLGASSSRSTTRVTTSCGVGRSVGAASCSTDRERSTPGTRPNARVRTSGSEGFVGRWDGPGASGSKRVRCSG